MKAFVEIDMPDKCSECQLAFHEGLNIFWCCITKDNCTKPYKEKNINCPLTLILDKGIS